MSQVINDNVIKIRVGTLAVITSVIVSTLIGSGIAYEKVQARLRHLDGKTEVYSERFTALEKRVDENDIKFAEIKKDLNYITEILLEVREDKK